MSTTLSTMPNLEPGLSRAAPDQNLSPDTTCADAVSHSSLCLGAPPLSTTHDADPAAPEPVATRTASTNTLTTSRRRQTLITILVVLTQAVQFWPLGTGLISSQSIAASLHFQTQHLISAKKLASLPASDIKQITVNSSWLAASYPLTNGTFILISGRLGDVWGHKAVLCAGCATWLVWHLGSGFATNIVGLCFMRALAGLGGALIVPNAVALLGVTFPPGKARNFALGCFGAAAPVSAGVGALLSGWIVQETRWGWVFWLPLILGVFVYSAALYALPWDQRQDPSGAVDWVGAYLGVAGLVLFNFVWNQAPATGWTTPYIYILLVISLLHLAIFVLWEAKVAKSPILPFDIWGAPSFKTLLLMCFTSYMSLGIFLWYYTLFGLNVRGYSYVEVGANYLPLTLLGGVAAFVAIWLVRRVPAQVIIALGNVALVACNILLATTPTHQTWWAMMFPAIVIDSFSLDMIFAASQIIASGAVGRKHQGIAGSLIGTLQAYGLSTGLGFAGTVEVYTNDGGQDVLRGYRHAFYFATGLAGVGVVGSLLFLRMPKNVKEGWDEDDAVERGDRDDNWRDREKEQEKENTG